MTRYTKLERRRPEFVNDTQHAQDNYSRSLSPDSEASTSAVKVIATPVDKDDEKQESVKEVPAKNNTGDSGKRELSEPAKLLKRAKLLRLKAKKAKDATRKQDLVKQVQEVERRVNTLNGERGKGKGGAAVRKDVKRSYSQNEDGSMTAGSAGVPVNPWKAMEAERRKVSDARSEIRREKREQERLASQRCFACRQMGHSAKDCSASLNESSNGEKDGKQQAGANVVCCYRCGSTEHSLAKCKRSAPQVGPDLPFASCFICGEKGHLASKCKQNQGRGIYPNGGCCKLCKSVDHLAKDCDLRTNAAGVNTISNAALRMGERDAKAGADEDDFHSLSRKRREIEEEEKEKAASSKKRRMETKRIVSF